MIRFHSNPIFKSLFEHHSDGVVTIDSTGRVRDMNPSFQALVGYRPQEIQGLPPHTLIAAPHVKDSEHHIARVLEGVPQHYENRIVHKNGRMLDVDNTLIPIRDGDEVIGAFCIVKDITAKKAEEGRLRESEERFKSAFDNAPIGMAVVSLRGRWLQANKELCRILDYTEEDLKKKKVQDIAYPDDLMDISEQYNRIMNGETDALTLHKRFVRRNGQWMWTKTNVSLIRDKLDKPTCFILQIQDITDSMELSILREVQAELLKKTERLSTIGQMISSIAHEVRNPLTSIKGFLQLLRTNASQKENEYYKIMLEEIGRANGIITDFLTLSKTRALELRERSLNEIIESIYPMLAADTNMSNHQLCMSLDETVGHLYLDEREIKQLVLNLVRNAIEAMGEPGQIQLSTERSGTGVLLQVEDTGCGIPEDILGKVFDPFMTTKSMGTGLGLPVCQSIVLKHGGTISVQSAVNRGTVFRIFFPGIQTGEPVQSPTVPSQPVGVRNE